MTEKGITIGDVFYFETDGKYKFKDIHLPEKQKNILDRLHKAINADHFAYLAFPLFDKCGNEVKYILRPYKKTITKGETLNYIIGLFGFYNKHPKPYSQEHFIDALNWMEDLITNTEKKVEISPEIMYFKRRIENLKNRKHSMDFFNELKKTNTNINEHGNIVREKYEIFKNKLNQIDKEDTEDFFKIQREEINIIKQEFEKRDNLDNERYKKNKGH